MKQLLNHYTTPTHTHTHTHTHTQTHNQSSFFTRCHHLATHVTVATEEKLPNQTNQNRHNTMYIVKYRYMVIKIMVPCI